MSRLQVKLESDGRQIDGVHVRRLKGREAISELFSFDLEVVCAASDLLPASLANGASLTLVFELDGNVCRRVHGMVVRIDNALEATGEWHSYRLHLRPRAFELSLVETAAVYVDRTIAQVIESQLVPYEFVKGNSTAADSFEIRLLAEFGSREFVVKYGESDLAFLSRFTEHYGISYFFEHGEAHANLVFTDHSRGFSACPEAETSSFDQTGGLNGVYELTESRALIPGYYRVDDYNYRTPTVKVTGEHRLVGSPMSPVAGGIVVHNAHVTSQEQASVFACIRAEEKSSQQCNYAGKSTVIGLTAGGRTTIDKHPRLDQANGLELLLIEVIHDGTFTTPWDPATVQGSYHNQFLGVEASRPFRPLRKTPKPNMSGVFSGVIQKNPANDTSQVAELDEQGRYRVCLHFDLGSAERSKTSNAMRMAQPFEGGGYGMHFPLRPGTEVLVAFTNGDPDRPVILGALPNYASPSVVTSTNAHMHRVVSPSGMVIEFGATGTSPSLLTPPEPPHTT